jgi:hypothetical protein
VESLAFIGFFYLHILNKEVKKAAILISILFTLFNFIYTFLVTDADLTEANLIGSVPIGIETIIILVFSFYFLYEKTNDTTTLYIYRTFPFWVVIGMVIYLSCSFFVYLFIGSIPENEQKLYWDITNVFGIVKNVLFTVAIIINSKPIKRIPPSDFEFSSLN